MRDILAQLDSAKAKLASLPMWSILRSVLRTAIRTALSPNTWWTDSNARTALSAILVAAAYYVGALIGFSVRFQSSPISPIWPPNVILLVALLLVPIRTWWVCLLAVCGAHMLIELPNGVPLATASGLYITNSAEAVIGALGVRHFIGGPPWLGSLRRVTIYLVCAVVAAPVITSFADAAVVMLTGWGDTHDYWQLWRTRCVSNIMAQLTIGPALLLGLTKTRVWIREATRWRCVEAALLAVGLLVGGITVFGGRMTWQGADTALLYVVLPFLLWAAIRFGVGGVSVSLLGITILATWGAVQGRGPFTSSSPADEVIFLQLFLIGISAPMLLLAALTREREETAAALQESQARFRTMADHAPVLIWMSGPDTLCTFFNAAWLAFTGRTLEQERGTGWAQGVHHDDLAPCLDGYLNAFALRKPFTLEYRLRRHDGAYRWVVDEGVPLYGRDGRFEGYIGSAIDITERRQAEEALRESEARYRGVVETQTELITHFLPDTTLTFVNDANCRYVGKSREELLGTRLLEDLPEAARERVRTAIQSLLRHPGILTVEHEIVLPDGSLGWQQWVNRTILDADGNVIELQGIGRDITERKQAEEALRESEARYRDLVESQTEMICRYLPDTTLTFVNEAFCRSYGRPREELIGTKFLHLMDEPAREHHLQYTAALLAHPHPSVDEHEVMLPDGTIGWQQWIDHAICDAHGHVVEFQAVGRDITERKRAEEALRESEARFRAAFESAVTGMMLVDTRGHSLKANRPLVEMLGYSEEELRSHTFADFTYAEDLKGNLDLFRRALAGEVDTYQLEKRFIHKQGHLVWGLLSAGVVRDAAGQPLYIVGQVQDITARKQAELALRESEERYRAVASNFPHGAVLLFDADLQHLFADGQGLPELGLSKASIEGKKIWEAFPDDLAVALAPRYEAALTGEHAAFDLVYAGHTYHMQILPIHYASTTAGMVVMQDVTEQRRAEALAELDRVKTAFFSNVSHELRTPLTLLLGPTTDALADREEPLPPRQRERLELIQRSGLRLQKLVNTLLDYSRIEAGRIRASYEPTDVAALTTDLASSFRSAIERAGLRLVVDCQPLTTLPVYVDRDMWEKIVLNLLSNALKYTFAGEIVVTLRPAGAGDAVELEVRDTGTGIAEAELPNLFERFYRVQGARARTHEGTGIGLALVQELARLHGGTVRVASTVGVGSAFTVAIPTGSAHLPADHIAGVDHIAGRALPDQARTPESAALGATPFVEEALRWLPDPPHEQPEKSTTARPTTPTATPPTAGDRLDGDRVDGDRMDGDAPDASTRVGTAATGATPEATQRATGAGVGHTHSHANSQASSQARILVADDNADMRAYLTRMLRERWEVVAVADGSAALAAARAQPPDLILADMMMPGLDGFALLRALRGDPVTRAIPVLLLSARAGEEATVEGLEAGADDYLVKPFAARELLARVRTHLELARVRRKVAAHAAQLEAIFDAMTDGVFVLGVDGRMTRINSAGRLIWGEAPDEVCPQTAEQRARALDLRDGDGRRFSAKQLPTARLLRGEALAGANAMTVKMHAGNGDERIVSLTGGPIRDTARQVVGAVGVFRDVTELRRIEAALAEQERIFRTLVENSPDIITRFDRNLRHLYVSPAGEALTGIPAQARVGKTYAELGVTEGLADPWEQALREVLATGEPCAFETRFQMPDKPPRRLHVRYIPEFAADGNVESVLGITSDITELKQAEARVAEQASQLEAIFEAHADGVGVYDMQGRFVRANRSLQALYGFDAEGEFTELPLTERAQRLLVYDEQGQRLPPEQWPHWRVLRGEGLAGANALETRVRTLDGREVWVSTTGAPIRGADGQCTGVVLITRDVTARRQLEHQAVQRASEVTAVFEAITEGISIYDAEGRILQSNHAFRVMLGLSADPDYLARPYPKRVAHLNARSRSGQPVPYEQMLLTRALKGEVIYADQAPDTIITTPDGREVTLSRSAVPMKEAQGRVLGAVIVHRDVTVRRQLERQVAEQASQLEAIFEAMTDGVFVWDMHGNIVRRNSASERILGMTEHDGFFAHSPDERARLLRLRDEQGRALAPKQLPIRRLLRGQVLTGPNAISLHVQTGDGHERHISLAGGPLRDANRQIIGAVGVFRDVTARRQLERQVAEQASQLEAIFEAMTDGLVVWDAHGNIVRRNSASARIVGLAEHDNFFTHSLEERARLVEARDEQGRTLAPDQLPPRRLLRGQVLTGPNAVGLHVQTGDGHERHISLAGGPLRDANRQIIGAVGVFRDVTALKQAEEALRAAKAAAEAARAKELERRREAERREQIAGSLREVLTIVNSTRSLSLILEYIARQAGHLLGSDAAAIYITDTAADTLGESITDTATDTAASARGTLALQAAYGLPSSDPSNGGGKRPATIGHAALGKAMAERRPVAVYGVAPTPAASAGMVDGAPAGEACGDGGDDGGDDGQAETGAGAEAMPDYIVVCAEPLPAPYRALLAVPIVGQDEVYGGIVLLYSEPRRFSSDEVALALAYGDQVALAIANARLQEHIERAAIETERNRLARELHDTVTQEIFSASLIAEAIPRIWEHHRAEAAQSLQQLHQITRSALAALRALLLELRPAVLEQKPLAELLRQLGDAMASRSGMPISLSIADDCPPIPSPVKVAIYRIAQEALMNAAKHANAQHIVLRLRCARAGETIYLEVQDDGQGFALGAVPTGHYGLGMMRERAQAVGATLRIRSRPGQGTRIVIRCQGHINQEDATSGRGRPEREEQTDGRANTRTRAHAGRDR